QNDVHWEYRADNKSSVGMKGTAIIHQGADLKIAHRSGALDGIEQKDGKDERGDYVQTLVYKKGCSKPFVFKAYENEYRKLGGFVWSNMPYNMLAKCSRVGALRLAFPEEFAGLIGEDEPRVEQAPDGNGHGNGNAPETSRPTFKVGETPEPVIP